MRSAVKARANIVTDYHSLHIVVQRSRRALFKALSRDSALRLARAPAIKDPQASMIFVEYLRLESLRKSI